MSIFDELDEQSQKQLQAKILTVDDLRQRLQDWRAQHPDGRIALTNGCYDLLHEGHVYGLKQSRERCDLLVVGVNSDASVRRLKGEDRPRIGERDRAAMLAAVDCVDYVFVFDEDFPDEIFLSLPVDMICKGEEWREQSIAGSKGRALFLYRRLPEVSTTQQIQQAESMRQLPVYTTEEKAEDAPYVHLFWSGPSFSYAKYLAVVTALKVHKPGKLLLWTMEPPEDNPWWQRLQRMEGIEIRSATELLDSELLAAFARAFARVKDLLAPYHPAVEIAQIKDLTVWRALYKYGGIFLDCDTISYRPFWQEFAGSGGSLLTCGLPATGVLAAYKESVVVEQIMQRSQELLEQKNLFELAASLPQTPGNRGSRLITLMIDGRLQQRSLWHLWCMWGPCLLQEYMDQHNGFGLMDVPQDYFYKFHPNLDLYFVEPADKEKLRDIRVLHIYGEGRNELTCQVNPDGLVTEEWVKESLSVYATIAREVLGIQSAVESPVPEGGWQKIVVDESHPRAALESRKLEITPGQAGTVVGTRDSSKPFLGLTVVMRNEKENVRRAFGSVKDIIDYWCLVDSGSTDGTIEETEAFFKENGVQPIPEGETGFGYTVYHREWKGYTKSRQEALELCAGTQWIMKLDMDEEMTGARWLRQALEQHGDTIDVVYMYIYNHQRFAFPRAWHQRTEARYVYSDHEVPAFKSDRQPMIIEPCREHPDHSCYVTHRSKAKPVAKVEGTCALARQDIDKAPEGKDPRMMFYLGRELSAIGKLSEGEYWLRARADMPKTWPEETFFTLLYLGDNLRTQERYEEAIDAWKRAEKILPVAREPLDRIGRLAYRIADNKDTDAATKKRMWDVAKEAFERELLLPNAEPKAVVLFVEWKLYQSSYDDELRHMLSVCCWNASPDIMGAREALAVSEQIKATNARVEKNKEFLRATIKKFLQTQFMPADR